MGAHSLGGARGEIVNRALEKVWEEFLAMLPPTIFFFVVLHVVALIRGLLAQASHYEVTSTLSIGVASLIFGKSVLIADLLPGINRFPDKPLVYNVLWKTAIYLAVASFIHYLERLFDFSREAGGVVAGNEKLLAEQVWPHFWAVEIFLAVVILNYCVARELVRVIGRDRVVRLFFGPTPLPRL